MLNGKEIGAVTSSGFSPRLERGITLAYVQRTAATEGEKLEAGGMPLTVRTTL